MKILPKFFTKCEILGVKMSKTYGFFALANILYLPLDGVFVPS
jgi:hypothetical protein